MRLKLAVLTAAAAAALTFSAHAQQAAQPAPPAGQSGDIDREPQPNGPYQGTNGSGAADDALRAKPVYAVIAGHVVSGDIQPGVRLDALRDARQPDFACHLFQHQTEVRLTCTDGAVAEVALNANGCGASRAGEPAASLCVGYPARAAVRRLTAPAGQALSVENGRVALKPSA